MQMFQINFLPALGGHLASERQYQKCCPRSHRRCKSRTKTLPCKFHIPRQEGGNILIS